MKSYYYGVVELQPKKDSKTKSQKRNDEDLLDYALNEGDFKFAQELMQDGKVRSFEIDKMNSKIERLEQQLIKLENSELSHKIVHKVIKKYHEEGEY